ncbi:MAG: hypothetical protein U5K54_28915 [Cytophagales bacterium]|nr:hypothetical protein [Cytophagales bacterium]
MILSKALPIELNYNVQNQNEGLATYFRTVLGNYLLQYTKNHGIDLYNSGLKIYTTIDSRIQKYAEESMTEHMSVLSGPICSQNGKNEIAIHGLVMTARET